jgi:hypothetical protein
MPAAATNPDVLDGGGSSIEVPSNSLLPAYKSSLSLPMPATESTSERTLSRTTARQHCVLSVYLAFESKAHP